MSELYEIILLKGNKIKYLLKYVQTIKTTHKTLGKNIKGLSTYDVRFLGR